MKQNGHRKPAQGQRLIPARRGNNELLTRY